MRSWRIGSAFGIGLFVHWTFLLLPAFFGTYYLVTSGVEAAAFWVALIVTLFGCVVLHEFGHALMARVFGVGTRDITMYPIGGVARLERMPESPGQELAIALAGPLVNVVIAAGLLGGILLLGVSMSNDVFEHGSMADLFLIHLFGMNVGLVVFNMIPAFPMDGGRVLRSVLAMTMSRLRATEIAVRVATVFALLFIVAGLFWGYGPMMALVGVFVMFAGQQELAMLRYREHARWVSGRRDPLTALPVESIAPAAQPAEPDFTGFTWDPRHGVWIQWARPARRRLFCRP